QKRRHRLHPRWRPSRAACAQEVAVAARFEFRTRRIAGSEATSSGEYRRLPRRGYDFFIPAVMRMFSTIPDCDLIAWANSALVIARGRIVGLFIVVCSSVSVVASVTTRSSLVRPSGGTAAGQAKPRGTTLLAS